MLHILLLILKILGILLAVLLGIFLLVLCIVLFVPVRYHFSGETKGTIDSSAVSVKITWFFALLKVYFSFRNGKTDMKIKVAWKNLSPSQKKKDEKPVYEEKPVSVTEEKPAPVAEEKSSRNEKSVQQEVPQFQKEETAVPETEQETTHQRTGEREQKGLEEKIQSVKNRIECTFQKACDKINSLKNKKEEVETFITNEVHVRAFACLKKNAFWLIKKLLPKRIQGTIHFGFDNPYYTGKLLSYLALIYPFLGERLQIVPDFEKRVLEGDICMKGRICVWPFVKTGLAVLICKDVRQSYKDIKGFNK